MNLILRNKTSLKSNLRHFSSSSQVFPAQAVLRNSIRTMQNTVKTVSTMKECHQFMTPDLTLRQKWDIFSELQHTDERIDLNDFLDGATSAAEIVMEAIYSDEFHEFCVDGQQSDTIRALQDVLSLEAFNSCVFQVQEADKRGMQYELRHLDVLCRSIYNAEVSHNQVRMDVYFKFTPKMRVTSARKIFFTKQPSSMLWSFVSPLSSKLQWQVRKLGDIELSKH